jgi:predicted XRE-type DNA-binding protein
MSEKIINSSGNVFIDLGFSSEEAAILQMRSELMSNLRNFIKAKKLTQDRAAKILGVSQSRVSDLIRGKWERFSLEMLITLAMRCGIRVSLKKTNINRSELCHEMLLH